MVRREDSSHYQCGIYALEREPHGPRRWFIYATGPGTIGDGFIGHKPTLAAAVQFATGEPLECVRSHIRKAQRESRR